MRVFVARFLRYMISGLGWGELPIYLVGFFRGRGLCSRKRRELWMGSQIVHPYIHHPSSWDALCEPTAQRHDNMGFDPGGLKWTRTPFVEAPLWANWWYK